MDLPGTGTLLSPLSLRQDSSFPDLPRVPKAGFQQLLIMGGAAKNSPEARLKRPEKLIKIRSPGHLSFVVSDSSQPQGLQLTRLPCPSPSPRVCPDSRALSWWCHPTVSSSEIKGLQTLFTASSCQRPHLWLTVTEALSKFSGVGTHRFSRQKPSCVSLCLTIKLSFSNSPKTLGSALVHREAKPSVIDFRWAPPRIPKGYRGSRHRLFTIHTRSWRRSMPTSFKSKRKLPLVAQSVKNLPAMQETWVRFLGRSPGDGNSNPLQYSCLENPMDRGAWQDYSPWGHKSWTWLSD